MKLTKKLLAASMAGIMGASALGGVTTAIVSSMVAEAATATALSTAPSLTLKSGSTNYIGDISGTTSVTAAITETTAMAAAGAASEYKVAGEVKVATITVNGEGGGKVSGYFVPLDLSFYSSSSAITFTGSDAIETINISNPSANIKGVYVAGDSNFDAVTTSGTSLTNLTGKLTTASNKMILVYLGETAPTANASFTITALSTAGEDQKEWSSTLTLGVAPRAVTSSPSADGLQYEAPVVAPDNAVAPATTSFTTSLQKYGKASASTAIGTTNPSWTWADLAAAGDSEKAFAATGFKLTEEAIATDAKTYEITLTPEGLLKYVATTQPFALAETSLGSSANGLYIPLTIDVPNNVGTDAVTKIEVTGASSGSKVLINDEKTSSEAVKALSTTAAEVTKNKAVGATKTAVNLLLNLGKELGEDSTRVANQTFTIKLTGTAPSGGGSAAEYTYEYTVDLAAKKTVGTGASATQVYVLQADNELDPLAGYENAELKGSGSITVELQTNISNELDTYTDTTGTKDGKSIHIATPKVAISRVAQIVAQATGTKADEENYGVKGATKGDYIYLKTPAVPAHDDVAEVKATYTLQINEAYNFAAENVYKNNFEVQPNGDVKIYSRAEYVVNVDGEDTKITKTLPNGNYEVVVDKTNIKYFQNKVKATDNTIVEYTRTFSEENGAVIAAKGNYWTAPATAPTISALGDAKAFAEYDNSFILTVGDIPAPDAQLGAGPSVINANGEGGSIEKILSQYKIDLSSIKNLFSASDFSRAKINATVSKIATDNDITSQEAFEIFFSVVFKTQWGQENIQLTFLQMIILALYL